MISVAEIVIDSDFAQSFTVNRTLGTFVNGRFVPTVTTFLVYGTIQPQQTSDTLQLPGGDQIRGAIDIWTLTPLLTAQLGDPASTDNFVPDEVVWNGEAYKTMQGMNWTDFGFYHSIGIRKLGA
jgi:hypothetical protein